MSLHPENETRLVSIPVSDSKEQTKAVLRALANGHGPAPDLAPWHDLQRWLAGGPCDVAIPFADALAELTPPQAVRLRRDFGAVLTLVRAHALLHRASRELDREGRIVATLDDYAAVRELVEPLIASGVGATVPETIRETVNAVADLLDGKGGRRDRLRHRRSRRHLDLDKAPTSRRVKAATERGYLVNHEDRKGRPAKIALGEPLPEDAPILPEPDEVAKCCSIALLPEGDKHPSPATGELGGEQRPVSDPNLSYQEDECFANVDGADEPDPVVGLFSGGAPEGCGQPHVCGDLGPCEMFKETSECWAVRRARATA